MDSQLLGRRWGTRDRLTPREHCRPGNRKKDDGWRERKGSITADPDEPVLCACHWPHPFWHCLGFPPSSSLPCTTSPSFLCLPLTPPFALPPLPHCHCHHHCHFQRFMFIYIYVYMMHLPVCTHAYVYICDHILIPSALTLLHPSELEGGPS